MFETGLDTRLCYVTCCKGTAMESRYLKLIFKNGRNSVGIWRAIILGLKGPVHFLKKEGRIGTFSNPCTLHFLLFFLYFFRASADRSYNAPLAGVDLLEQI